MEGNHRISEMHDLNERGIRVRLQKPINYGEVQKFTKA